MSEDKKSLIDLVPDSIDNAVKNITDKPTQNMGTTLADIWYLVFGGISQAAEKKKLKYSYALQEFEKELKEKISKIPKDKLVEPDIQVVAPALEASKYCVEKEELRHIFSSLITSSLTYGEYIPPMLIDLAKHLSVIDAKILDYLYRIDTFADQLQMSHMSKYFKYDDLESFLNFIRIPLVELEQMNLICNTTYSKEDGNSWKIDSASIYERYSFSNYFSCPEYFHQLKLTPLGETLCKLCQ